MRLAKTARFVLAASMAITTAAWSASNGGKSEVPAAASDAARIPITTSSDEAKKEFLEGRDLSERLLGHESIPHFDKALSLDPYFASAELARANNSTTAKEFFEHQKKAVGLADKASEGEKLQILANEAATNGDVEKQKEYLDKLVSAYPNDERAQFALANFYFGQQEIDQAVAHYQKVTELAPNYSPVYNSLGYAYRQQENYSGAERAFKKYVELIPRDPNPYDSYAELLLKMGRFNESIAQYKKALALDPLFPSSVFGIAANEMYLGKPDAATAQLQKLANQARGDGELRTAYFGMAVVAADAGRLDQAVQAMDKEFAVAEKKDDKAAMAADLQAKANILMEMANFDEARRQFDRSLQLVQSSNVSQDVKDNAALLHHFNLAACAIEKKDYAAAKTHAEEFRHGAEMSKNPQQLKQSHELAGRIALGEKDYEKAVAELAQSNQQNPANLYRLGQAYQGKGDKAKAQDFCRKAAEFYSLPQLNYAFIRARAEKLAGKKKA